MEEKLINKLIEINSSKKLTNREKLLDSGQRLRRKVLGYLKKEESLSIEKLCEIFLKLKIISNQDEGINILENLESSQVGIECKNDVFLNFTPIFSDGKKIAYKVYITYYTLA